MHVPFIDLKNQYQSLKSEFESAIHEVCEKTAFILGPEVSAFEEEFAEFIGSRYCVGVASGTDALTLSFQALELEPGDEVIVPAHTFVATIIGILNAGLKPIPVDIGTNDYLIDVSLLESALSTKTRAICPVHLYGRVCNMTEILSFAEKHDLNIIEDSAQAHGAQLVGKTAGTFGLAGCFSFYPGKNLGAFGDAGAVCTNSEVFARDLRLLRNYGSEVKYHHLEKGTNSRLDSLQAAVLRVKLKRLAEWNRMRHQAAKRYCEHLTPLAEKGLIALPKTLDEGEHVFHLFVIQLEKRDEVISYLADAGIQSGIHYPIPFYKQDAYFDLGYREGDFPVCDSISKRILSLPMFPEISEEQIAYVAKTLTEATQRI